MGHREVGGYRGRRTVTDILRFIAIALAVVVILVVAGVLYLQKYLVYTDDGVRLELPPFLQMLGGDGKEPEASTSLPGPGSLNIDVQPGGSQTEEDPPEEETPGFALALPVSDVLDGTAAAKLEQAGAEALILEVKDQEGRLAWLSACPEAERAKVNGTQASTDALHQWNQGGVYTIARVCCFRDNSVPYFHNAMALRQGNGNWRDELGLRWLSPAQNKSQAYIAALCSELAQLGFDEIVLEQFAFPVQGKTDRINRGESYSPDAFADEMEEFLTGVRKAVEPYGTRVSLRVDVDMLEEGELSGLSPDMLDRLGARFWSDREGCRWLGAEPSIPDAAERVVEIVPQAGEDRTVFQAVIPQEE